MTSNDFVRSLKGLGFRWIETRLDRKTGLNEMKQFCGTGPTVADHLSGKGRCLFEVDCCALLDRYAKHKIPFETRMMLTIFSKLSRVRKTFAIRVAIISNSFILVPKFKHVKTGTSRIHILLKYDSRNSPLRTLQR